MQQELTSIQSGILKALAAGSSVSAVANAAGIHRTTIHHWCRTKPAFQIALETARHSRADAIHEQVSDLAPTAVNTLQQILQDEKTPAQLRLKAALAVINIASKPLPDPPPIEIDDSEQPAGTPPEPAEPQNVMKSDESDETDENHEPTEKEIDDYFNAYDNMILTLRAAGVIPPPDMEAFRRMDNYDEKAGVIHLRRITVADQEAGR